MFNSIFPQMFQKHVPIIMAISSHSRPQESVHIQMVTKVHNNEAISSHKWFLFHAWQLCISWLSKKQPIVATSSCEAEYRTVFTATVECVWLRRLMVELGVGQDTPNTIYTDSQSALAVARNPVFHARTKHIEVHYHYVRERLSEGEISLAYVPTPDNLAGLFTKTLSREKLEAFRKALGLFPFVD
ncbi:hypothetical protein GOP47_0029638 [Adiantum capillus-veneris]|nr:hypothetical protein GOP47_0029638 [Adiantum capillus-veneris]